MVLSEAMLKSESFDALDDLLGLGFRAQRL